MAEHNPIPEPDPQRIVEDMAPAEDRTIYIEGASRELWELVEIALRLERQGMLGSLLAKARFLLERSR